MYDNEVDGGTIFFNFNNITDVFSVKSYIRHIKKSIPFFSKSKKKLEKYLVI